MPTIRYDRLGKDLLPTARARCLQERGAAVDEHGLPQQHRRRHPRGEALYPSLRFVPLLLLVMLSSIASAQIATDGSVGPAGELTGPHFQIGHDLGSSVGSNLFHSFQRFNIQTGESATFTGPDTISNVISRVTGGERSMIDGLLRSQVGGADFYFLNPAGLLFGANAEIDVPAAFHVSSADELRFADATRLSASDPTRSTLTSAAPEAFGFLGAQPAEIILDGSRLTFKPGSEVSLSGGDVTIAGDEQTAAELAVEAGSLRIVAIGDQATAVAIAGELPTAPSGTVTLTDSQISSSGDGGGALALAAGNATLTRALLDADNSGRSDPMAPVTIVVPGTLSLDASRIGSASLAEGASGGIRFSGGRVALRSGGTLRSLAVGSGAAGDIVIDAAQLEIDRRGAPLFTRIWGDALVGSSGHAANIHLRIDEEIEVLGGAAEIASRSFGAGDAGEIVIDAGALTIDDHGSALRNGLIASAEEGASGAAGRIQVQLKGDAMVTGVGSTIRSDTREGDAHAPVTMSVGGRLSLLGGAIISSSSYGVGDAGGLSITAGQLAIAGEGGRGGLMADARAEGRGGDIGVTAVGGVELLQGGVIQSLAFASGDAGAITLEATDLTVDRRGEGFFTRIWGDALADSSGAAADITLRLEEGITLLGGGAEIAARALGKGDAGDIEIESGRLTIDDLGSGFRNGVIASTEAGAAGAAGTIQVQIAEEALLTGSGSTIHADTSGPGAGGEIDIDVNQRLEIFNGATISSSSFADGAAGDLRVKAATMRIDGGGSERFTGLLSDAKPNSTGAAGSVSVVVDDALELVERGQISNSSFGAGDASGLSVTAGSMRIDGQGRTAGIGSISTSEGNAGAVAVSVAQRLEILDGGQILGSTFGEGHAGGVTVEAGAMRIDGEGSQFTTGLLSNTEAGTGDAGAVQVVVDGSLEMVDGGVISSDTFAQGDAGSVSVTTGSMRIARQGSTLSTGISSQANIDSTGAAGAVKVTVTEQLELLDGGGISSGTFAEGDAGSVTITAREMRIDRQGSAFVTGVSSQANSGSSGAAGRVSIRVAERLTLQNGGQVSSSTFAEGDAGGVTIEADTLRIDGRGADGQSSEFATGIGSQAERGSTGAAGMVSVTVEERLELLAGGLISSSTFADGAAGSVTVHAGAMRIDGEGATHSTGITSDTYLGLGHAGPVSVTVDGLLEIERGGRVSSTTFADGAAGSVTINAGALRIDGRGSELFAGVASVAEPGSTGDAGPISVTVAEQLEILGGGEITSSTSAEGDAGSVTLDVGAMRIDRAGVSSEANPGSTGAGGPVSVNVARHLEILTGGVISSSTFSAGDAGSVSITARSLRIDGNAERLYTGIASETAQGSGDAGSVSITVSEQLELSGGGVISSDSSGAGRGGRIEISADTLRIAGFGSDVTEIAGQPIAGPDNFGVLSGVVAGALPSSNGQVGGIDISARQIELIDGGAITIRAWPTLSEEALAEVEPRTLRLSADQLSLSGSSWIAASAFGNTPGHAIDIDVADWVILDRSQISTSANENDGGAIQINADQGIELTDSLVTTSVTGRSGDGGNIALRTSTTLMSGGFVQANAPAGARGGDISVASRSLIAEQGLLEVGDSERQVFEAGHLTNIIQAAAPGGEQGTIEITAPELDLSGALLGLSTQLQNPVRLAADPCTAASGSSLSSLLELGRGGLPSSPAEASSPR